MTEGIKPEKKMHDIESTGSVIDHEQTAQTTEANMVTDQNAQAVEADMITDQNTQMTETDLIPGQNALSTEGSTSDMIPEPIGQLIYRCRKCRQIVASDENIVSHEQGNGEASFNVRKKSVQQSAPECTAIFVEPLQWMVPVQEGYLSEKLYCIGCKSKLGYFTWVGMQCSCGAWVRPAFQIHKSRVDECRI